MADETRRSPWLPVNDSTAPAQDAGVASVLPAAEPFTPSESDPAVTAYIPPTRQPSRTPDPVAPRRASVLAGATAGPSTSEMPLASSDGWSSGPGSTPIPTVGLAPALENPEYGATFVPETVDVGNASALSEEFAVPRPAEPTRGFQGRVPRPVEVDDVEVIRPVAIPPASEILPTAGTVPTLAPADDEYDNLRHGPHTPIGPVSDPFHLLGVTAVANASLAAAGAREPAHVEWATTEPVPLEESAPFVPAFDPNAVREPAPRAARDTQATQVFESFVESTMASAKDAASGEQATTGQQPVVADDLGTATAGAGTAVATLTRGASDPPPPYDLDLDSKPWWRKTWLLILVAVVVLAGVGTLVYRLFFLPEPIILPAPVVTEAPPAPTIEPVELEDASPLLDAMPQEVSTLVMTSYVNLEVIGDKDLPARASEHLVLTYGEQTAQATFTVNVYQFYNVDEAQSAFDTWLDGQTTLEDVTVNGTVVGQRGLVPGGAADTLVWRNETVVFVMQGPADELLEFYSYFGI